MDMVLYLIPLAPSATELMDVSLGPAPLRRAEYEPQFEGGLFRVADDGAYLYRHRAVPLTPQQRAALAEGRREAKAAEKRRTARMDENWRKVREERPDYPEDWRDLF